MCIIVLPLSALPTLPFYSLFLKIKSLTAMPHRKRLRPLSPQPRDPYSRYPPNHSSGQPNSTTSLLPPRLDGPNTDCNI